MQATKTKDNIGDTICYELMTDEDVQELEKGCTIILKVQNVCLKFLPACIVSDE